MGVHNARVMGPAHVENVVELACRTALAYRGVAHITMPVDIQTHSLGSGHRSKRNVPNHVSDLMAESAHAPTDDQLARAAAILNEGRRIAILAGRGALHAREEVIATTAVKYDLDVKIIVIKNNTLGQIKWEQMVFLGNPEYVCELEPIDFATVARGFGMKSFTIEDPKRCADTLRQAIATPGPVLVEAVVDPHEPPMPPTVSAKQAVRFANSLASGTPNSGKIALTVASNTVRELI
jgi:thiamine pyrophosphate-dependent acetolactate synthase large subunit-like protein